MTAAMSMIMAFLMIFIIFTILFILFVYLIANYVVCAIALHRIASRRGIPRPWLAWVPCANSWILGSIADEYSERLGIKSNWKKILIGLVVLSLIFSFFSQIASVMLQGALEFRFTLEQSMVILFFAYGLIILQALITTVLSSCQLVCIYKVFESTVPEKVVKYILLFIIVPVAGMICLWKCKDQGYPYPEETKEEGLLDA